MKKIWYILCVLLQVSAVAQKVVTIDDVAHSGSEVALEEMLQPTTRIHDLPNSHMGRSYYDRLVKKASKRHIAVPISFSYTFDNTGFNSEGRKGPLAQTIFGTNPITVRSIYLFSRLSDDNKVRINNTNAKACERGAIPIGQAGVPFGGFRDDLYTTLLAPVALSIDATERQFYIVPSIIFHTDLGKSDTWAFGLGVTFPFKNVQHEMELTFQNGDLFREGFLPQKTQRETSLDQFYRDFSDVQDFLNSAVLAPQGLSFQPYQSKTGFADVSVFFIFECHAKPEFDFGLTAIFPTGGKDSGTTVWQPVLGNGGAFQLSPFLQILFSGEVPYLSPFIRCAVEYSFPFTPTSVRVPRLVTNSVRQQVKNVAGLLAPEFFESFYVDPFVAYDSEVPLFAGRAKMSEHIGTKLLLGVGNYAYDLFHVNLRFGFFYDFMYKAKDSFREKCGDTCFAPPAPCTDPSPCSSCGVAASCAQCVSGSCSITRGCSPCNTTSMITTMTTNLPALNVDAIERNTNQMSHTLSANLVYTFNNMCELGFGGQCVVRGKNVPQYRSIYVSVTALF